MSFFRGREAQLALLDFGSLRAIDGVVLEPVVVPRNDGVRPRCKEGTDGLRC
jgi:hypothetical protein